MTALEIIRLVAEEFQSIDDDTLSKWIELVSPMVSKKMFGKLYEYALAYLVCHKLKMAGKGEDGFDGLLSVTSSFGVGSVSEGGSSISFSTSQSSNLATDAELALTSYGLQYLSLRRLVIVPIRCSGE